MKFQVIALSVLLSSPVLAGELDCGHQTRIPESLLAGLEDPACIAIDVELGIAVVAGEVRSENGPSIEVRAISVGLDKETKMISSVGLADQVKKSVPYHAFARACGLPLSTARVASANEVVLIYDLFNTKTAFLWRFSDRTVSVVTTDYDSKKAYFCNGKARGIASDLENIAFDRDGRTIALRGLVPGSPTVRAKF